MVTGHLQVRCAVRRAGIQALTAAFGLLLVAGCAHKPPEPVVVDSMDHVTATVESINPSTRVVGLNSADGLFYVEVGPEVRNFGQIRVGDQVNVAYYEAVAAQLKPRDEATAAPQETVEAYRAPLGSRPGAAVGHTISTTVKIQSVDTSFNTVTFQKQDGSVHTVAVNSPQGQAFLKSLHPGDEVDIAYTEAVAVAVTAAR
jgi:hypothetical protein